MQFITHSFRHAEVILNEPRFVQCRDELFDSIAAISEDHIISAFNLNSRKPKSISEDVNRLLRINLNDRGWAVEPAIFQDENYLDKRWRLDFAKEGISVEVAFNHGEAIAWNLLKPVLASELNHVKKEIQTEVGVIVCATRELKTAGGFDNSVGDFEKFLTYLEPLQDVLTVPILIIGLTKPHTFRIEKRTVVHC